MTDQHVTPTPLWRRFLSSPRTRPGWSVGLAAQSMNYRDCLYLTVKRRAIPSAGPPVAAFSVLGSADYRGERTEQVEQAREVRDHDRIHRLLACKDDNEVSMSLRDLVDSHAHASGPWAGIPERHERRMIIAFGQEGMSLGEGHVLLDPGP
jgi:hypothetical protein